MRIQATVLCAGVLAFAGSGISAQTQTPHITSIAPIGATRGTKTIVTIEGTNLAQATALRIEGEGVTVSAPTLPAPQTPKNTAGKVTFELTIAPNALPGRRALRVYTPFGASDLGYFVVDRYPDVAEKEPNSTRETAQEINITTPMTIVGAINPGEDVDYFRFAGKKGETLIADVQAARIGSSLDSVLILQDDKGREIAQNEDYFGADSFLAYTFPADGTYLLRIHDLRYQGGGNQYYRLTMGSVPNVLTGIFPAGGTAGKPQTFDLIGYNLPTSGKATQTLPVPESPSILPLTLQMENDLAYNAVSVQASTLPEVRETEPNETRETAQRVTVPTIINGRIFRADSKATTDRDFYRFHAEKGQRLFLEITARWLGSPMDSFLTLYDNTGKELASNDDAEGKDSRIDFTAPTAGDYTVQVSELTQRMGENYVYRLSIAPPVPDFALSYSPDNIVLGKGGSVLVRVAVNRLNGFELPIALTFRNLPPTVRIQGIPTIAAGQTDTNLVLTSDPASPIQLVPLQLEGTFSGKNKEGKRMAAPLTEFYTKNNDQVVRNTRPSVLPTLSVTGTPDLIVSLSASSLTLNPGKTAELSVKIARAEGFKAKVPLVFVGLPSGVSAAPAEIPENQSEVKVTLKAEGNAALGIFPVVCTARVVFDELHFTSHAAPPLILTVAK